MCVGGGSKKKRSHPPEDKCTHSSIVFKRMGALNKGGVFSREKKLKSAEDKCTHSSTSISFFRVLVYLKYRFLLEMLMPVAPFRPFLVFSEGH